MSNYADFEGRGLVYDATDKDKVRELLDGPPISLYAGFDPTVDSLHVGNMVPLLTLARLQRYGHRPIVLAGGATGLVGDPSGKSNERNLLTAELLAHNVSCVKEQLARFVDFDPNLSNAAILVDNADWIGPFSYLEFLRDVGKHFSVNVMMQKESIKGRLDTGISYTEFSYMLLQAYDFLHLYRTHQCVMQVGGSDQWGNITAGTDLIRRVERGQAWGCVQPLLTDKNGKKVGKTTDGAVYLDAKRTSPTAMYQYFLQTSDEDVHKYLQFLTFLPLEEISELGPRVAQKRLASEFTAMIHGADAARLAEKGPELIWKGDVRELSRTDLLEVAADLHVTVETELPIDIVDLAVACGALASKGQARRMLQQKGLYLNNQPVGADASTVGPEHVVHGNLILLGAGKKKRVLIELPGLSAG
jgi:tyrosyl-tRNA synthetase